MKYSFVVPVAAALALTACASTDSGAGAPEAEGSAWSIVAEVAESCCCDAICPCMVGSAPTRGHCEGTRLIDIRRGRYGDVALDGVPVLATFRMGEWVKLYVGDEATPEQARAAGELIAASVPPFASWGIVSTERVPVSIERTEGSLAFSAPDCAVEMDLMVGAGGEAIRVENITGFPDYTQYKSRVNSHTSPGHGFEYSGTNGFTASMEASGP